MIRTTTATRLRQVAGKDGATTSRLNDSIVLVSQGSRDGNPGLKDLAPLGHKRSKEFSSVLARDQTRNTKQLQLVIEHHQYQQEH
jgi:hypothetical protein